MAYVFSSSSLPPVHAQFLPPLRSQPSTSGAPHPTLSKVPSIQLLPRSTSGIYHHIDTSVLSDDFLSQFIPHLSTHHTITCFRIFSCLALVYATMPPLSPSFIC